MSALLETQVRSNVVVWTLGGEVIHTAYGTNCTAIIAEDAVILVDPLIAPAHARQIEAALKERTQVPVRFVVLTHHHTDHTLGASWCARQGAAVIAHHACRERMGIEHPGLIESRREAAETRDLFADAMPVRPSVTFDEGLTLHASGLEVEVWHPGWGHTPGDAFLYLPAERVAVCGDLVFNTYHYNYEDASLAGVRRGLEALRALDADTFIPGHGPVAGPQVLEDQGRYHDAVEAIVREGAAEDKSDTAIEDALRARFPDFRLEIVIPTAVTRIKEHIART